MPEEFLKSIKEASFSSLYFVTSLHFNFLKILVMPARLTQDLRNTIQSLLQRGHSFSKIKSMYPGVGSSTLTRLRKLYCPKLTTPLGGRPKKFGGKTISRVSREL
jgi:hypothetical protein